MIGLRTTISGTTYYVDMFEDVEVKLNLSFAEIQNITLRNSTYSNTFYVPGSKENNKIFQYFFNINAAFTDFDVRRKMDAILTYDGWDLMAGYVRLNFVNIENRNIIYNLTFYSDFGNLVGDIGDKFMRELDLSDLSHPFNTPQVILDSLKDPDLVAPTGTTAYETGKTYWLLANYGYEYDEDGELNANATPIIDYQDGGTPGYFDYIGTPVRYYYFKPTIQIKELYEKIFNQAGYEIQSDFFDTAYFKRFYLPQSYNPDGLYFLQGTDVEYSVRMTGDPITLSAMTWTDTNGGFSGSLSRAQLTPTTIVDNTNINGPSSYTMTLPSDGIYKIRWALEGYNTERIPDSVNLSAYYQLFFHQIESGINGTSGTTIYRTPIYTISPGGGISIGGEINLLGKSAYNYSFDNWFDGIGTLNITNFTIEILSAPKSISGNFDYSLEFPEDEFKQIDFIRSINTLFNLVIVPSPDKTKTLLVEPMVDFVGTGDVLDWTRQVDRSSPIQISPTSAVFNGNLDFKYKLDKDFGNNQYNILSNKTFGDYIFNLNTDYKDSTIAFDTGLSTQVDYTLSNITEPIITLPYYFITTEKDNNGITELYFNPYKIIPRILFRGTNLPSANIGYTEAPFTPDCDCRDVELENNNPYIVYVGWTDCYGNLQGQNLGAFLSTTFCYCNGSLSIPSGVNVIDNGTCTSLTGTTILTPNWWMENNEIDAFPLNNRFITYPFAVSGFSHYTNFNSTSRFDASEYNFSNYDDFYEKYYKDYVDDLNSVDSRIWDGYVYLTPQEIQSLTFKEKILIDNTYFRINKIEGYDPTTTEPVKVQLVKLTKSYSPHPIAYYDLIACGPYANKHTNTDLTFGIWNYLGNYWKIGDNCYEIRRGEYNSNYTYERIETTYSGNSYIPNVYTDCNCNTKIIDVNVYQNPPYPPTPTPTIPPFTPTPTPSYSPFYYYYIVERCGVAQQLIARSTAPVVIGSVVEVNIPGLGSFCYVVIRQTSIQSNNTIIASYIDCNACANPPEPTPTSTPTNTPTPTPTRTLTPTPTPVCINCEEWSVENENPFLVNYQYTDCNGVYHNNTLGSFQTDFICLCEGTPITSTGGSVITNLIGSCNATPTPTPTRTLTPTPTPTASQVVYLCYEYEITNESAESQLQYQYVPCGFCENAPTTAILNPSQIALVCACDNSVSIISGTGNIVKGVNC